MTEFLGNTLSVPQETDLTFVQISAEEVVSGALRSAKSTDLATTPMLNRNAPATPLWRETRQ